MQVNFAYSADAETVFASTQPAKQWSMFAANGFSGEVAGSGTVYGTAGFQEIAVFDMPGWVTFDPSFNRGGDIICLKGDAKDWKVVVDGSLAVFTHAGSTVTIPLGAATHIVFDDGARTLVVGTGGTPSIGGQAITATATAVLAQPEGSVTDAVDGAASARVFLTENGTVTIGGKVHIFGTTTGKETVDLRFGAGTFDASFNRGGDTVLLNGAAGDFKAAVSGSKIAIDGPYTDAFIPIGTAGIVLTFNDGTRVLRLDPVMQEALFGTQTVESTATRLEASAGAVDEQVLYWNQVALDTIASTSTAPTAASRALAIQSIAVYDALAAIGAPDPFMVDSPMSGSADLAAAVAYASYTSLLELFPAKAAFLLGKLEATLSDLGTGASLALGQKIGSAVAHAVVALRAIDGNDAAVTYVPGTQPGDWVPTSPGFAAAEAPQWGKVDPFLLTSPGQFRASAPASLTSAEYAAAINQVKALGSASSAARTADQTEMAVFWRDALGTYTPSGHWNVIAALAATAAKDATSENALTFAMLNVALADAGVAAWDTKYFYELWRPITAIRNADLDGNAGTTADPEWTPLFTTPAHPDYPSGHSTYSAAGAAVLTAIFGERFAFSLTSQGAPGVTRLFDNFAEAADEAGMSRIYGGIHTSLANSAGNEIGAQVGEWVVDHFPGATNFVSIA